MNTKHFLSLIGLLICCNCANNISSSELKETKAQDLKLTATVYELNGKASADVYALAQTLPDEIGVQFNEGELFQVSSEQDNGEFATLKALVYDDNVLDLGEQYTNIVTKPSVGRDYKISYTDRDGLLTAVNFDSKGCPDLVTPTPNQVVPSGGAVELTWQKSNLGNMTVKVSYDTIQGGNGIAWFSASDTGHYTLDLSHHFFDNLAAGATTIELSHLTTHENLPGWGETAIHVQSMSRRQIVVQASNTPTLVKALMNPETLTIEEVLNQCLQECAEGEKLEITFQGERLDCCE